MPTCTSGQISPPLTKKIVPNWNWRVWRVICAHIFRFLKILQGYVEVLDPWTIISSIIVDARWRVWRWDFLAEVRVQEGEPLENALRRFKRKVQQEDIIKEVKRHSYYLKPGEKKRVKAALARKRNRKKARKEQD
jgi:small subunit ribosomal protein S21